ncbi:MAG TPA: trehalose-6-phosphate synthase, partial [Verrucomicrobiota bacterium]|nr:trehalose-6-phosphate synthase [Verrucomicrobiota bacterium]
MRLVIVSNRLPFTVTIKEGKPCFESSPGGLSTGLWSYLEKLSADPARPMEFVWVGWPGTSIAEEHHEAVRQHGAAYNAQPVFLPEENMERFYHGFCNRTLWPLFHYFP